MADPGAGPAHDLVLGPAQDAGPGGVHVQPGSVRVGDAQQVARDLPDSVALGRARDDLLSQDLVQPLSVLEQARVVDTGRGLGGQTFKEALRSLAENSDAFVAVEQAPDHLART